MRITARDMAHWGSGVVAEAHENAVAEGISFDSRSLSAGQAFVAVRGGRDGHGYLPDAIAAGASVLLVEHGRGVAGFPCVEVDDTLAALASIARGVRGVLGARNNTAVVGITGSAGKTSTKNMVRSVLGAGFASVQAPTGSFNNDLGVPVTIINAPDGCTAMVLELAMRGHGEIARLCAISRPTVALLTVIGDAHSDRVGGIEGVARAKGEILEGMDPAGTAVVNLDDPWTPVLLRRVPSGATVVTYGRDPGADVRFRIVARGPDARARAEFVHGQRAVTGSVPLPGDHMASNAAAAVAAGVSLGMDLGTCVEGLSGAVGEPGRMQWTRSRNGMRILDDSYNANTSSVLAALEVVAATEATRRVAVLGIIAEVSEPERVHAAIARHAADLGIELLALETDLYGVPSRTVDEVREVLAGCGEDCVLLVKGSRVADTGRVIDALSA